MASGLSPPTTPRNVLRRRSYSFDSAELEIKRLSKTSNLEFSALQSLASRRLLLEDQLNPRSDFFYELSESDVTSTLETEQQKLKKYSEELIATVLLENLSKGHYDPAFCSEQAFLISRKVEDQMRQKILKEDQKVLAVVYIGEVRQQGIQISSQCIWDLHKDFMASASFSVNDIFAVCYVFVLL